MATPSAKSIYEAARAAIFDLIVDGKASASFQGRSYTANDLEKLRSIERYYKSEAVRNGEIDGKVSTAVSTPRIENTDWREW